MTKRTLAKLAAIGLFSLSMMASAPAQAEVEVIAYEYSPPSIFGGLSLTSPGPLSFGGEAGRFRLTTRDTTTLAEHVFNSFCIDVATSLFTFSSYEVVDGSVLFADAAKRSQLAALLTVGNPLIDGASDAGERSMIATALALAIWEITYDQDGSYDVASGNFSVYGDFAPLVSRSNSYLANARNGTWTGDASRLRGLVSTGTTASQNQIYLAAAGVPEPSTWAMLILGFGLIGGALRRRSSGGQMAQPA